MSYRSIAIAGPPHSGKSTIVKLLKEKLGWEVCHIGSYFRIRYESLIKENPYLAHMSFAEYFKTHATEKDITEVNHSAEEKLKGGNIILDSRFAYVNARNFTDVLTVLITAPLDVRAKRVQGSDEYPSDSLESIKQKTLLREESEVEWGKTKFSKIVGEEFDYRSSKWYDLVIDSSLASPEEECEKIVEALRG